MAQRTNRERFRFNVKDPEYKRVANIFDEENDLLERENRCEHYTNSHDPRTPGYTRISISHSVHTYGYEQLDQTVVIKKIIFAFLALWGELTQDEKDAVNKAHTPTSTLVHRANVRSITNARTKESCLLCDFVEYKDKNVFERNGLEFEYYLDLHERTMLLDKRYLNTHQPIAYVEFNNQTIILGFEFKDDDSVELYQLFVFRGDGGARLFAVVCMSDILDLAAYYYMDTYSDEEKVDIHEALRDVLCVKEVADHVANYACNSTSHILDPGIRFRPPLEKPVPAWTSTRVLSVIGTRGSQAKKRTDVQRSPRPDAPKHSHQPAFAPFREE
jgi:hypothetical protein